MDKEIVIKSAEATGAIVTAEEHSIIGGLGGAVSEVIVGNKPVPVEIVGVKDVFTLSGSPRELMVAYGLTSDDIVAATKRVIQRKG